MFDHNEQPTGPHYDEMPFVRSVFDVEEDTYEGEDDIDLPLPEEPDEEELELELDKEEVTDPTDVPEPLALLAKMKEVKAATIRAVVPVKRPRPAGLLGVGLAMAAASAPKKGKEEEPATALDALEEEFFKEGDKMNSGETLPSEVIEFPQKRTWWNRLTDKIDSAVEKFGNFLDHAVPSVSVLGLVATLGGLATHLADFNTVVQAQARETVSASTSVPIQTMAVTQTLQATPPVLATTFKSEEPSNTLWTTNSTPSSNNQFLVEKKTEIVKEAGGEKADYLHSAAAYSHFTKQLQGFTGFPAILSHPEVQKAKNIAEMLNIIDRIFGEKVGDLVEANAAAMHLSATSIQSLR